MTGVAQKGGAVTTYVKIAVSPERLSTIRIAAGEADAVIGADLLVAAENTILNRMRKGVTRAVLNTNRAPTVAFYSEDRGLVEPARPAEHVLVVEPVLPPAGHEHEPALGVFEPPSPGGMPDDCRDDLAEVHPGVTTYGTGACPVGEHACTGINVRTATLITVCMLSSVTCPTTFCTAGPCPPAATFDYDCSGTNEPQPSAMRMCSGSSISTFGCNQGDGIYYTTAPLCGATVTQVDCGATGGGPYTCAPVTSMMVHFPCR